MQNIPGLQPVEKSAPPSPSGVHMISATLGWNKKFSDKSSISAELVHVRLEVDFDEVEATDEGINGELILFFQTLFGWYDYRLNGFELQGWEIEP